MVLISKFAYDFIFSSISGFWRRKKTDKLGSYCRRLVNGMVVETIKIAK